MILKYWPIPIAYSDNLKEDRYLCRLNWCRLKPGIIFFLFFFFLTGETTTCLIIYTIFQSLYGNSNIDIINEK